MKSVGLFSPTYELGMQVCTIASLKDLLDYLAINANPNNPALQVHEAAIKAYRHRYGV